MHISGGSINYRCTSSKLGQLMMLWLQLLPSMAAAVQTAVPAKTAPTGSQQNETSMSLSPGAAEIVADVHRKFELLRDAFDGQVGLLSEAE
eukprot:SAG31_NODE_2937_length_4889_cov_3.571399_2_plen_91_part_00